MIHTKLEIGQEEIDALIEIMLASPVNVKKRKIGRIASTIGLIALIVYSILFFSMHKYVSVLGIVFVILFAYFIIDGGHTLQKYVYKMAEKKLDDKLKSGVREYNFDVNGVSIVSEIGSGLNNWNAFKSWGIFKEYIYLKRYDNQMILVKKQELSEDNLEKLLILLKKNITEENIKINNK